MCTSNTTHRTADSGLSSVFVVIQAKLHNNNNNKKKQDKNSTPCFCTHVTFLSDPNITSSYSVNATHAPYSHTQGLKSQIGKTKRMVPTRRTHTAAPLCPPPRWQHTHNRRRTWRFSARQSHCLNHKHAHLASSFSLRYIYTSSLCIDFNIEL